MLYVFLGTDRQKARAALNTKIESDRGEPSAMLRSIRITDANSLDDLSSVLNASVSMFDEKRAVILDGIASNEEMRSALLTTLPVLAASADHFFVLEEKPDAELKKKLQKYAEKVETFDAVKKKEYPTVFKLADYLKSGDKKNLWVSYQRELSTGNAPEAIHGVLFWGAKQALLAARGGKDADRSRRLLASLVELPHEARRRGEELEYALERFILSFS
jgi:hypothetical protein